MGIQQGLPIPHLPHPLLAPQILVHIRRPRRVVELVPVGLTMGILPLGPLLLPAPAALPLLGAARIVVLFFLGGSPIGEGASWWLGGCGCGGWGCGGCRSCCCGCDGGGGGRRGFGEGGFGFRGLFDLRAADGLEAEGCAGRGVRVYSLYCVRVGRETHPGRLPSSPGSRPWSRRSARDRVRWMPIRPCRAGWRTATCRRAAVVVVVPPLFSGGCKKLVVKSSLAREAEAVIKFKVELQITISGAAIGRPP